jgi:hypothetical protein
MGFDYGTADRKAHSHTIGFGGVASVEEAFGIARAQLHFLLAPTPDTDFGARSSRHPRNVVWRSCLEPMIDPGPKITLRVF